jgi:succinoglycan biosynthesis protein ExoL
MDFVFLLSHIPNPRMNKRIGVVKSIGTTALIYWDKQDTQIWELYHQDIDNNGIVIPTSGAEPIRRLSQTMRFIYKAYNLLLQYKPKCLYVGNLDMLFIAWLYSLNHQIRIIYEVADLNRLVIDKQKTILKRMVRKILGFAEIRFLKKIAILVLTSEEFYKLHYYKFLAIKKILVMPNMPELSAFNDYTAKSEGSFVVGFIGGIRYIRQMKMLVDAAAKCGIKVLFAGSGFSADEEAALRNYCRNKEFVEFYGRYDFYSEVSGLYGRIDCVYSVYDADMNNVKVALPNKLYEAIYCGLPIIVAKGTYLATLVEAMGVGIAVSHTDVNELIAVLEKLAKDKEYYSSFTSACRLHKEKIDLEYYNKQLKNHIGAFLK